MEKELIDRIKENDEEAFLKMLDQYHMMIHHIIHHFSLEYGDYAISHEDLYQEGMIALLEACRLFDFEYDVSFSTYAYTLIKRRIQRFLFQALRRYQHEGISIDRKDRYEDYALQFEAKRISENPESYFANKEKETAALMYFNSLNKEDQMIVKMREKRATYAEISDALNISTKRIDNRLQTVKRGYKKYLKSKG